MRLIKKTRETAWYYKAERAYRKGKIPAPYSALFEYYTAMEPMNANVTSEHYAFFIRFDADKRLDNTVKDLRAVLPDGLLENLNAAYEKYLSLGGELGAAAARESFAVFDDYVFDNFDKLLLLLKNYVDEMVNKHLL